MIDGTSARAASETEWATFEAGQWHEAVASRGLELTSLDQRERTLVRWVQLRDALRQTVEVLEKLASLKDAQ
jgi:hypothetical protein